MDQSVYTQNPLSHYPAAHTLHPHRHTARHAHTHTHIRRRRAPTHNERRVTARKERPKGLGALFSLFFLFGFVFVLLLLVLFSRFLLLFSLSFSLRRNVFTKPRFAGDTICQRSKGPCRIPARIGACLFLLFCFSPLSRPSAFSFSPSLCVSYPLLCWCSLLDGPLFFLPFSPSSSSRL